MGTGEKSYDNKSLFWNSEIEQLIEEKKSAYRKGLDMNEQEDQKYYSRLSRVVKKEVPKTKLTCGMIQRN